MDTIVVQPSLSVCTKVLRLSGKAWAPNNVSTCPPMRTHLETVEVNFLNREPRGQGVTFAAIKVGCIRGKERLPKPASPWIILRNPRASHERCEVGYPKPMGHCGIRLKCPLPPGP